LRLERIHVVDTQHIADGSQGSVSLRRATWRHNRGVWLIRAFDQLPYALECDVFHNACERNQPEQGSLDARKDALEQTDSCRSRFSSA
jgi:hypothetical protein